MKRSILAISVLFTLCAALVVHAGFSIPISINFDGTVDTQYRDGSKPQGGSCPTGWTCTGIGDGTCDVNEVDANTFNITASGSSDSNTVMGYCFVHKQAATESSIHLEALIPAVWTGHIETWTSCGVAIREGTSTADYYWHTWWPDLGTARYKFDASPPGWPWTSVDGAPGQFLPYRVGAEYDSVATDNLSGWESSDGVSWTQIGLDVDKTLTFPVEYGVFCTSHDPNLTTTVELDLVVANTTLSFSDTGPPPAPIGNDHLIAPTDRLVDCLVDVIEPGDTITLDGTSREQIRIDNCTGTPSLPITLRNDVTESGTLVIQRPTPSTGDFVVRLRNVKHFVVDGTGGWLGSSGTCSGLLSWPTINTPGLECGITISSPVGDGPSSHLNIGGTSSFVTVKGVEIDGGRPDTINGIGLQQNANNQDEGYPYTSLSDPVNWREGMRYFDNYIHDTETSCMYLGPNYSTEAEDEWKLKDIDVHHNRLQQCGDDGIKLKSSWGAASASKIHHNHITEIGISGLSTATGATDHCIVVSEGNANVYNNFCRDNNAGVNNRTMISHHSHRVPVSFGTFEWNVYNNVVIDSDGIGIGAWRDSSADVATAITIYNNTIIDSDGHGVNIGSIQTEPGTVRDNIVADASPSISTGASIVELNNIESTVALQDFVDPGTFDFHLTATSEARNAVTRGGAPPTDHDNIQRPQEGVDDVGAYEFVSGIPTAPNFTLQGNAECANGRSTYYPGMRGFGACTRGGFVAGTTVHHITTTTWNGAGSLGAFMAASCPKVGVFDIAGEVDFGGQVEAFLACDGWSLVGETAPSPGIWLRDVTIWVKSAGQQNAALSHVTIGAGDLGSWPTADRDVLQTKANDSIFANLTLMWGVDETIDCWPTLSAGQTRSRQSLWQVAFVNPLEEPFPPTATNALGHIMNEDCDEYDINRSVYINAKGRAVTNSAALNAALVNNVVANCGHTSWNKCIGLRNLNETTHSDSVGPYVETHTNIIGNIWTEGPDTNDLAQRPIEIRTGWNAASTVWETGNSSTWLDCGASPHNCVDEAVTGDPMAVAEIPSAMPKGLVPETFIRGNAASEQAFVDLILQHAGSRPADRHAHTAAVFGYLDNYLDETQGGLVDNVATDPAGGWPTLTENTVDHSNTGHAACGLAIPTANKDDIMASGLTRLHETIICCHTDVVSVSGWRPDTLELCGAP